MSDRTAVKRVLAIICPDTVSPDTPRESPDTAAQSVRGSAIIDLERAITDPKSVYESPEAVVAQKGVSRAMRGQMLQAWEQDVRAEMVEENEGGPVKTTKADILVAIRSAKALLTSQNRTQHKSVEMSK